MKFFRKMAKETETNVPWLRVASTYYTPEGRYFYVDAVLKTKKRSLLRPVVGGMTFLVVSLAGSITTLQPQFDFVALMQATSAIDYTTTSSIRQPITPFLPNHDGKVGGDAFTADEKHAKNNKHAPNNKQDEKTANFELKKYPVPTSRPGQDNREQAGFAVVPQPHAKLSSPSASSVKETNTLASIAPPVPAKKPAVQPGGAEKNYEGVVLAYAPKPTIQSDPFEGIIRDPAQTGAHFVPPIGKKDHAWAATPLPASAFKPKQQKCLAEAIYYEARGESVEGQVAVAQVVLNRVRNPAYPDTICGVVYQNTQWHNRCQFSFACDGKKHKITEKHEWKLAQKLARTVLAGQVWLPSVGSATHYHATYVKPKWAGTMVKVDKIGQHIFYRTHGGGWS